jgi:Zn-dependent peptidase ImmA (M78 family)
MANLGTGTAASSGTARRSDDPESIALRERDGFGITPEIQTNWRHSYDAFNAWREVLNAKNIMVFQMSMPIEDARGFTLADQEPSVIVVNSSDTIEARIFTLFHEYGHLLLKDAGICMPENAFRSTVQDGNAERWCNEFASAVLLPKERLNVELGNLSKEELLERSCLGGISRRYKVSKSALLLYMMKNRYISRIEYDAIQQRMKLGRKKSKGFSAIPVEKRVMQERGKKYISLVAKNVQNGNISKIDALEYLSIKLPSLDKVVAMAER